MATQLPTLVDSFTGDSTGLTIPTHGEALMATGPEFLTQAFRAFGAIGEDNAVTRIVRFAPCPGGSTGAKFFLTVEYAQPQPGLATELFVKFSRDFTDRRRDSPGRWEMQSEVPFCEISRGSDFPIDVPTAYFADYDNKGGNGLVITETIPFGQPPVEPHRAKCLDHLTLPDPLPYYRAVVTALARLAAAQKAGRLAPDIEARFPFDPVRGSADPIRYDDAGLETDLARCADFAERCPQLLPPQVRTPEFLAQMANDARRIRAHEAEIRAHLIANPDMIALLHWNAHIDNCWFWRDPAGELHCGLIDWGRVGQITFGSALWGGLSAAHHDIWDRHLPELLALFAAEYHGNGGPLVTVEELELHLTLHIALMAVARVLVFPEVILFRLPEAEHASGPYDPIFETSEPARNCLHIYTVLLKFWQRQDFGAALDRLLAGEA